MMPRKIKPLEYSKNIAPNSPKKSNSSFKQRISTQKVLRLEKNICGQKREESLLHFAKEMIIGQIKKLQKQVDVLDQNSEINLCVHSVEVLDLLRGTKTKDQKTGNQRIYNVSEVITGGGAFSNTHPY